MEILLTRTSRATWYAAALWVLLHCGAHAQDIGKPTAAGTPAALADAVTERSLAELQASLQSGKVSAEQLVRAYLQRIERLDRSGPRLRAIIAVNPNALAQARTLDEERRTRGVRGPLHGIPILLKDNIESSDPMPTTAGSLALKENVTAREGPVVAALRARGAIILGKTNMSEWAGFRSVRGIGGWSAVGGLTLNPYVLDRTSCGSSSGSAAAIAASLAAASLGTETDGSITCPASMNAVVGLKPTLGLLSHQNVVPVSRRQDTIGPIGRTVQDVALLLQAMSPSQVDYVSALSTGALKGKRVGLLKLPSDMYPEIEPAYCVAKAVLRAAGATLIDVQLPSDERIYAAHKVMVAIEFKEDLNAYLATAAPAVKVRNLAGLIEFNARTPDEMELFGQEFFTQSQATSGSASAAYRSARSIAVRWALHEMEGLMDRNHLDVLVGPSAGPPWRIDLVTGDHPMGMFGPIPTLSGYPHLTVPMGFVRELPIGLSFIGRPASEAELLGMGYAFESRARARHAPKFLATIDNPEALHEAMRRARARADTREDQCHGG